jgi:MYXO-CTERM domain-containing protein
MLLVVAGAGITPGEIADPTLFGRQVSRVEPLSEAETEARRAAFVEGLEERGLVQIGDQVRPMDATGGFAQPIEPQAAWASPAHRSTIFLNFFGATLTNGTNAALDESTCVNGTIDWPGFTGNQQQALALIQVFENQMAPYGVRIAYEERPPAHLPYAMVMMGGTPQMLGLGGSVLGVSCSSDCGDQWWRDTTFAFTDNINPNNPDVLGTTALHEAAHAFGLAHIDDATKIMNPYVGNADVTWASACTPYNDATGGINCQSTHREFCDGQDAQNTDAELMAYFGPNSLDTEPPVVDILSPADGTEVEIGGAIDVEVDVYDDHEGIGWKLVIVEAGIEDVAYTFQKKWHLGNLPQGVYTVRVEAIDHERNEGSDEVKIYVGESAPIVDPDDPESDDSGGEEPDPTAGSDDDSAMTDPDGDTDPGLDDPEAQGCGCVTSGPTPTRWGLWSMLLLGLGLRRRRAG